MTIRIITDAALTDRCDGCGIPTAIHLLDGAPRWWRFVRWLPGRLRRRILARAADRGVDFSISLCRPCYGPEWVRGEDDAGLFAEVA